MAVYDTNTLSSPLDFANDAYSKCVRQIPGTDRVLFAWLQSSTVLNVQAFGVNTSTGALSAIGSPVDIETQTASSLQNGVEIVMIDDSNALVLWSGESADGYARLVSIDGSGNCSTNGSALEFDTSNGQFPSGVLMDSTHVLAVWVGSGTPNLKAQILTVNTGTGSVTATGSPLGIAASANRLTRVAKLTSTKAVCIWNSSGASLKAQTLSIDTSTWAVTTAGADWSYSEQVNSADIVTMNGAGSPATLVIVSQGGNTDVLALQVSTSTWNITSLGSAVEINTNVGAGNFACCVNYVDSTHVLATYCDSTTTSLYSAVYTYSSSTGMGSATANTATVYTTNDQQNLSVTSFSGITQAFVAAWRETGGNHGIAQALQVTPPSAIKTVDGLAIASVKTVMGLAIASVKSINGLQ